MKPSLLWPQFHFQAPDTASGASAPSGGETPGATEPASAAPESSLPAEEYGQSDATETPPADTTPSPQATLEPVAPTAPPPPPQEIVQAAQTLQGYGIQVANAKQAVTAQIQGLERYYNRTSSSLTAEQDAQIRAEYNELQNHMQQLTAAERELAAAGGQLASAYREHQMRSTFEPLAREKVETRLVERALGQVPGLPANEQKAFTSGLKAQLGAIQGDARDALHVTDAYVKWYRETRLQGRADNGTDFMGGSGSAGSATPLDNLRGDQLWDRVAYKQDPRDRRR